MTTRTAAIAALLALAAPAAAQDRPREEDLFGASPADQTPADQTSPPADQAAPPKAPEAPGQGGARPREEELFGAPRENAPPAAEAPRAAAPAVPRLVENPLAVGGVLYLRTYALWQKEVPPSRWTFSSPDLLDVYFDVRPNDRVRGFALGRMLYDPAYDPNAPGVANLLVPPHANPRGILDQLWVNFDVARRVFVTAGKQHVKWGVGRFWNPTDFLHPVNRDPLALYDERSGVTMLKAHLPWEQRGWNFYGVALLEDVSGTRGAVVGTGTTGVAAVEGGPVSTVGRVGAGGRAEVVLGTAELGADAVVQRGNRPRVGVDVSAGIWDVDLYAEAALRTGIARWERVGADAFDPSSYVLETPAGLQPQVTAGGTWSWKYSDEDVLNLGAEYFYNAAGYDTPRIYPVLILAGIRDATTYFRPFYLGRHYAGAFVNLPKPGRWNDTDVTVSVLANASDRSFVARLDHVVVVNTYLRVETFVAGHFGTRGGEFRFALDARTIGNPPQQFVIPAVAPPVLEGGVAVRVSL